MKTILLKFSGPLQSWGSSSHFETRHTDFYPSKSAIVGLLSACLGYKRDDDENIRKLNELDFAVRIDQQGNLLRDYHTARKCKKTGEFDRTYVTNRYYLEDAVYLVALSYEDNELIEKMEDSLKSPYFQPSMGRRSLPLTADFFLGSFQKPAIEILREFPWQAMEWYQRRHKGYLVIYADADLLPEQPTTMRKDYVISFSQKERKFGFRAEARMQIEIPSLTHTAEHNAFDALGGDDDVFI